MDIDIKSSEAIHNNVEIYLKGIDEGEVILIKHEDKITIDVMDGQDITLNSDISMSDIHKKLDTYIPTMKYGEIRIIKKEGKTAIKVNNRNREYMNRE